MSKRKQAVKRRYVAATVVVPLVVTLSVPQARAQLTNVLSQVNGITNTVNTVSSAFNGIQSLFGSVTNLFDDVFNFDTWLALGETAFGLTSADAVPPEVAEALRSSGGELATVRDEAQEKVAQQVIDGEATGSPFSFNGAADAENLANATDRTLTHAQAQQLLSREGQRRLDEEIEGTKLLMQQTGLIAEAGQSDTVTQDVMKKLLTIQANQTTVLGQVRSDALRARIDTQYTNINLANISQTLDAMHAQDRNYAGGVADLRFRRSAMSSGTVAPLAEGSPVSGL